MVKTPAFHAGIVGSNPARVTFGGLAQLGEHLPYKQGVTGSIPVATTKTFNGSVAQLVRVPACHAGGRGFEPLLSRHIFGPLVKRLRHHPFTVVTGVRFH